MRYLIPAFILMPILELYVLIQIGEVVGAGNTIALVVATGIIGGYLARREGLRVFAQFQQGIHSGNVSDVVFDGLLILVAGIVLLTPGIITDIVGLLLLMPPVRRFLRPRMKSYASKRSVVHTISSGS